MKSAKLWRNIGFASVYGLSALAITFVFWRTPQPSADTLTTTTTSVDTTSPTATSVATTDTTAATTSVSTTPSLSVAQKTSVALDANSAYGISGNAVFTDVNTVVIHKFSIISRGLNVQIQLLDTSGTSLGVLKDISKQTYNQEDLVLAVPNTIDISKATSLAIVAPDYNLVLSKAQWTK